MSEILDRLRTTIESSDESRYQISMGSGVSQSQLSRFVRGDAGLSMDNAERLADYLGLELVLRKRAKRKGRNP